MKTKDWSRETLKLNHGRNLEVLISRYHDERDFLSSRSTWHVTRDRHSSLSPPTLPATPLGLAPLFDMLSAPPPTCITQPDSQTEGQVIDIDPMWQGLDRQRTTKVCLRRRKLNVELLYRIGFAIWHLLLTTRDMGTTCNTMHHREPTTQAVDAQLGCGMARGVRRRAHSSTMHHSEHYSRWCPVSR